MIEVRALLSWFSVALIAFYGSIGGVFCFVMPFGASLNDVFIFPILGEMRLWVWETISFSTLILSVVLYRLGKRKILPYYIIALLFSSMLSIMSQLPGLLTN